MGGINFFFMCSIIFNSDLEIWLWLPVRNSPNNLLLLIDNFFVINALMDFKYFRDMLDTMFNISMKDNKVSTMYLVKIYNVIQLVDLVFDGKSIDDDFKYLEGKCWTLWWTSTSRTRSPARSFWVPTPRTCKDTMVDTGHRQQGLGDVHNFADSSW